ncbi:hypothetical protein AB0D34_45275 [Streptomyces sp. NPDC048420]|uniref:hypothetical protein n=1 Tax=Streptomyces sp. NPDC048420 TaxID=3155755 RepID=UPI0034436AA2
MTANRTVLIPDEEDFLHVLVSLDETLMLPLVGAVDDMDAGVEDAWQLPEDFNAKAPNDALGRVFRALPAPLQRRIHGEDHPAEARVLLAADGVYEHMPFYPVVIEERDLVVLRVLRDRLTRVVNREEDGQDLLDFLHQVAEDAEERPDPKNPASRRRPRAEDLVADLAMVVGVLELDTDDTRLLRSEIEAKGPGEKVVLTLRGEAAYKNAATTFNKLITGGNAMNAYLY